MVKKSIVFPELIQIFLFKIKNTNRFVKNVALTIAVTTFYRNIKKNIQRRITGPKIINGNTKSLKC